MSIGEFKGHTILKGVYAAVVSPIHSTEAAKCG